MTIEEAEKVRGYSAGYVYACTKRAEKYLDISETFSKSLKSAMKHRQITAEQLEQLTGFTDVTIARWINGRGYPSIASLLILSDVLNVSIDYLLKDRKAKKETKQC